MQVPDLIDRALILVVERDPHIKKLERFFLEQAGYRVEFAEDGMHGLGCAGRHVRQRNSCRR